MKHSIAHLQIIVRPISSEQAKDLNNIAHNDYSFHLTHRINSVQFKNLIRALLQNDRLVLQATTSDELAYARKIQEYILYWLNNHHTLARELYRKAQKEVA